jgi:CheY-like chemotaxis protein/two-component sensor histidine kinase
LDAERANAAKSEFLSRMSHELRTPLNAVLGFGQLLELDPLSEAQRDAVQHILRGGRHLLEMIDDVLDISRIETDQLDVALEPVSVNGLLRETIGLLGPMAAAARIEVSLHIEPAAPERQVLADRRRLRQVMLNLLSNAIKYNRSPGWVRLGWRTPGDGRLLLWVQDSGIGITERDLPRLFVPFDRFGDRSGEVEGSGIGLALSRRLVEVMDGTLSVESRLGEGSTFTVSLPLLGNAPADRAQTLSPRPACAQGASAQPTLLYIEHDESNLQLLERIMQRRPGWKMQRAGHGALGLELAGSIHPDLILLNVQLPDMSGLEVLRQLRARTSTAAVPVTVLSAEASPLQAQRAVGYGAEQYLSKPLDVGEILALIDRHSLPVAGS